METAKDFKIGLIYKYTSPSGKVYIGQTINEKSRKNKHKTDTPKSKTHFGNAIKKYGFENFTYEVLIKFKPNSDKVKLKRVLDKLEKRYIKIYKSNNPEFGYNLTLGGEGNLGYIHREDSIQKMKDYMVNIPDIHREKLSEYAKARCKRGLTEAQIKSLEKGRNTPPSKETCQKISDSRKNKKKVYKYDLEDNLIATFNSIEDAARSIEEGVQKTKANKISECCSLKRKTIYSYKWTFSKN